MAEQENDTKQTIFKYIAWGFGGTLFFLIIDKSLDWSFIDSYWPLAIVVIGFGSSWGTWKYLKNKAKNIDEILKQVARKMEDRGHQFIDPREFEYEEMDEDELAVYSPSLAKTLIWSIRKQNIIRSRTMSLHQYKEEYMTNKFETIRRTDAEEQRDKEEDGS